MLKYIVWISKINSEMTLYFELYLWDSPGRSESVALKSAVGQTVVCPRRPDEKNYACCFICFFMPEIVKIPRMTARTPLKKLLTPMTMPALSLPKFVYFWSKIRTGTRKRKIRQKFMKSVIFVLPKPYISERTAAFMPSGMAPQDS